MINLKEKAMEMLSKHLSTGSIAAIIIALGALYVTISSDLREDDKQEHYKHQDLLNEFRLEVARLRDVEVKYNSALLDHSRELSDLRTKIVLLESTTLDSPLPTWLKTAGTVDQPGTMMMVNDAYSQMFLLPFGKSAADYIGKTDVEYWGEQIGDEFWKGDMQVIMTGDIVDSYEPNPHGGKIRCIKYPRKFNRKIIGVAGVAIPADNLSN